jgi:hypothetical protein
MRKPGRPRIELHWSLVDRANLYRIPDDEILSRAIDFKVGHITFKVLSAEDTLIYLCLHAAKHGVLNHLGLQQGYPPEWFAKRITGNRLLWFMDIQLLLKKEWANLDWAAVTRRMNQWNVVVEVAECLHVLRVLNAESAASHALEKIGLSNVHGAKSGWISSVLFGSRAGRCLLENVMRMNPALLFRPVRILLINRLLFPSSRNLLKFYGVSNSWCAPALYVIHPFVLLLRLFGRPRP